MDSGRRVLSAALSQKQWCWRVRAHGLARGVSMKRADMNRTGELVPQEASAGESVPRPFRSAFQAVPHSPSGFAAPNFLETTGRYRTKRNPSAR